MVQFALGADSALMSQHDVLGDGESEPRAPRLPGAGFVDAVETLEQARQVLKRNTRAEIAHIKFNSARRTPRPEHQAPSGSCILEGIVDEIGKNLVDGLAIGTH